LGVRLPPGKFEANYWRKETREKIEVFKQLSLLETRGGSLAPRWNRHPHSARDPEL